MQPANLDYEPSITQKQEGYLVLSGDLLHEQAKDITDEGQQLIQSSNTDVIIDLSELGAVNTVTVAVLLQWIRIAQAHSINLSIQSAPKKLISIITFSGLKPVFKEYLETV